MTAPTISAIDLSRALGQEHPPTPEQREIIEAPLEPLLVVAGAGSGKTETMTARVVWLVANGLVAPEQVLGLTFTRKAAGELAERVARRLMALEDSGVWSPQQEADADGLGGTPTVSTYHAYAGRLVREGALRLGYEKDSRMLSEAAAWQLAHEVVLAWDGPMSEVDKVETSVTAAIVSLAGELAEHLLRPGDVEAFVDQTLAHLASVEETGKEFTGAYRKAVITPMREQRLVLPIVERYQEVKRERSVMDFSDQMALAAALATRFPEIGRTERERFRVVMLDEFQDTSTAQMTLMQRLFAPEGETASAVTAVGDPHQSIYAWRGASATTLDDFKKQFGVDGRPTPVKHLSTSWRNDVTILEVANAVAAPLAGVTDVPVTRLRARPGAGRGQVEVIRAETAHDEAARVAEWIEPRRGQHRTAAVLCRKRSQFPAVVEALAARNIPHEVVGLGGLLLTPEVADVVALLTVVQDPSRGDKLMRLLTGPLARLGPADLDALGAWARHLSRLATAEDAHGPPPGPDDGVTIIDALARLPEPGWEGSAGQHLSEPALTRLHHVAGIVDRLRRNAGVSLPDLVGEAERELGVDIEVLSRPGWTPAAARAHLDAFADVAAQFSASSDRPTLGGFIAWVEAAIDQERGLEMPVVDLTADAVQVLTCHAAKGLEWDVVAVPGLCEGMLPAHNAGASAKEGPWRLGDVNESGWITGLDGVPYPLRGDRDGLPHLDLSLADAKALQDELKRYRAAGGEHGLLEERRLAYVAFTRARSQLLLGSWVWGVTGQKPRLVSRFIDEAMATGVVDRREWVEMPDPEASNPSLDVARQVLWPAAEQDDSQERRVLAEAAQDMRDAEPVELGADPLDDQLRILLEERERRRRSRGQDLSVELPAHLSTSQLVSLARDARGFALDLRRPMPQPPQVAGRRGTAFHAWVEEHYADAGLVDVFDLPGSADESLGDEDLSAMQEHFLASEWADRVPLEVELSLEIVLGGHAVRGRVDAVFADDDGGVSVVDWKTGRPPRGAEARVRAVQLSAYRIAYARWRGIDPERVRGAFFHAATGETLRPELLSEDEIVALLGDVVQDEADELA